MRDKMLAGHLAAFVTILIWGNTFISTKVLLNAFTPIEILFIRFMVGYIALWCVCPRRLVVGKKQELYFMAAGLCGVTLYYLFENIALTYTLASNVGTIISIEPFFTVIFSCIFLHERRPSARFFFGFVIAMAGIVCISFGRGEILRLNPLGDILAIIAAVIWAAYSTLTKKLSELQYPAIQTTRRTFFYGLLFMLPAIYLMDFHVDLSDLLDPKISLNLIFLGLGASALCFVTWNSAVKRIGPVKTSVYIYMVPVITAVTAALVLQEQMTPVLICGICFTFIGLCVSGNRKQKKGDIIHDVSP